MRTSLCALLRVGVGIAIALAGSIFVATLRAEVALSAASIEVLPHESWLLYGDGLDAKDLDLRIAQPKQKPFDAEASLRKLLSGAAAAPQAESASAEAPSTDLPPANGRKLAVLQADAHTAAIAAQDLPNDRAEAAIVWARAGGKASRPLVVGRPEIWTVIPRRALPGQFVRVFGPNIGTTICLVDESGTPRKCDWAREYSNEKSLQRLYECSFRVPVDAKPGAFSIFVNNARADYAWSEPAALTVVSDTPQPAVTEAAVAGNGGDDEAAAIQQAIDKAAKNGGVVFLKPGLHRVSRTIEVKPGVTLRGAGAGATRIMLTKRSAEMPISERRIIVELASRTTLEYLTIDGFGDPCSKCLHYGRVKNVTVHDCELTNLEPIERHKGGYTNTCRVVEGEGDAADLRFHHNTLRGAFCFANSAGGITGAWFDYNDFYGLPTEGANVLFWQMNDSLFEGNVIHDGGRGLVLQIEAMHNVFLHNRIQNTHGIINGSESFLYEATGMPWCGAPARIGPRSFVTPGQSWNPKSVMIEATGRPQHFFALITAGRGMGQMIAVERLEGDTVTLARPWTLPPDEKSEMILVGGCVENLHIENQITEGRAYSGVFGTAVRNLWAGDELNGMSSGFFLWGITAAPQISLNTMRNMRLRGGEGLKLLLSDDEPKGHVPVRAFGNEFHSCQVYDVRRLPGNEYSPSADDPWKYEFAIKDSPGNPRYPRYGWEPAIHLATARKWPGIDSEDDPAMDREPSWIRWTIVSGNFVDTAPVGLRIASGVADTIATESFMVDVAKPISDNGRNTFIRGLDVRKGPAAEEDAKKDRKPEARK